MLFACWSFSDCFKRFQALTKDNTRRGTHPPPPPQTYAEGSRKNTGNLYLQMHAAQAVLFQITVADPPTDCLLLNFFVITMTTFVSVFPRHARGFYFFAFVKYPRFTEFFSEF